jgi:hypothetical protein
MLIDCSYFTKGPRRILNASLGTVGRLPNANATEVADAIEAYISEYQEEYLAGILGNTVGNKVNAYLVCLEEDENPTCNANIDAVCERLRESFADYVFFRILRDTSSQSTITGLVRLKCANEYVAPIRRQVNAWNSMVNKHRRFAEWCQSSGCTLSGINISSDMLTKINQLNL